MYLFCIECSNYLHMKCIGRQNIKYHTLYWYGYYGIFKWIIDVHWITHEILLLNILISSGYKPQHAPGQLLRDPMETKSALIAQNIKLKHICLSEAWIYIYRHYYSLQNSGLGLKFQCCYFVLRKLWQLGAVGLTTILINGI